ncbi:ATP-dependent DNA helicase Q1 [Orchesella cincta]|uniref:ATP-dependent DNA helicase n=1 Tax=Orchesella cincta TaxID=48709 RepID=A0A1D2M9R8_ORCCI|nr:ATP-dependent DNA helicase Q1 [Orchesella cincta]
MMQLQEELRQTKDELTKVTETLKKLQVRKRELDKKVGDLKTELKLLNETESSWTKFEGESFSWSAELRKTMSGLDVILIMPTGGGKSLVFQLPAVLSEGVTIVVSPLISLMEDQLQGLKALGISSAVFNSQTDKDETKQIFNDMIDPRSSMKLLYVTPEKLAKSKRLMSQMEKMYRAGRFARLVIDEVHCCSQWGHDFRKDYTFLGIMKTQYPKTPILGLTATATCHVIVDVQKMLNIEGCLVFKDSFFRPNLKYEVRDVVSKDKAEDIVDLIKKRFEGQTGIIYCLTIKDCEDVCQKMRSLGIRARPYHAQLEPELRTKAQHGWYSGQYQVIVATVAFGMGINKLDVRFVIHHSMSKSLENYYQETGRAGRDGEKAYCILYYKFQDVFRASSLMFTEKNGVQNVYNMLRYSLDKDNCRKSLIAQHFGDSWDPSLCTEMCDNCDRSNKKVVKVKVYPILQDLMKLLTHASQIEERMTALKLMDAWFGKGNKKCRVDSVPVPKYEREVCERVIASLIVNGYLKEEFHFTPYSTISYLVPGSKMFTMDESTKALEYEIKIKEGDRGSLIPNKKGGSKTKEPVKKKRRISYSEEEDDAAGEIIDLDSD